MNESSWVFWWAFELRRLQLHSWSVIKRTKPRKFKASTDFLIRIKEGLRRPVSFQVFVSLRRRIATVLIWDLRDWAEDPPLPSGKWHIFDSFFFLPAAWWIMEHTTPACALTDCVSPNNWNKISRVDGSDDLRESWNIHTRSKWRKWKNLRWIFNEKKNKRLRIRKKQQQQQQNKQTSAEM